MNRIIRRLKQLSSRILQEGFRRSAQPYRPDLSDGQFFDSLCDVPGDLRNAKSAYDTGDKVLAQQLVVQHFRVRRLPRFFIDIDRVPQLTRMFEQYHPNWKARTIDRCRRLMDVGLPIYGRDSDQPLGESFDWAAITHGPGNDMLYAIRPHRFGFAPSLALAAHYGVSTFPVLCRILADWTDHVACGDELPYYSNLVVEYRMIALTWTWAFVAGLQGDRGKDWNEVEFLLLKILQADARFLRDRIGGRVR